MKMLEEKARGTSISSILPLVIVSSIFYFKFDNIDWWLALKCAVGGLIGGAIGAKLLKKISPKILNLMFIIFLTYSAIRLLFF